jgi:hypothetical protein
MSALPLPLFILFIVSLLGNLYTVAYHYGEKPTAILLIALVTFMVIFL